MWGDREKFSFLQRAVVSILPDRSTVIRIMETRALRRYLSMQEIRDDPRFLEDNAVSLENYAGLEGWYAFPQEEVRCCVSKAGHACRQPHRKGWVSRLKDGSISIIGGDCAKNDFGAGSIVGEDIRRAQQAIELAGLEADVRGHLRDRDAKLQAIDASLEHAKAARRNVQAFLKRVGQANEQKLLSMSRSSGPVTVLGINPAKYGKADESGNREKVRDASTVAIPVGIIEALAAINPDRVAALGREMHELRMAYSNASTDALVSSPKELRKLRAGLADYERVSDLATQYMTEVGRFLAADLTPACFLVPDLRDRNLMAKIALERLGKQSVSPSNWLGGIEEGLRRQYGVSQIQIQ